MSSSPFVSALLLHPQLHNCRRLFLHDYAVPMNIGVHDFEKKGPQTVRVNVDLYIPLAVSTPEQDALNEVVDYDVIRETLTELTQKNHIHLQETLCDEVARRLLAHPHVKAVRVMTLKPDVYPDCAGVGVEVFHIKSEHGSTS